MLTYFWNFFTTIVSGTINLLRLNNWNVRGIGRLKEADFRQCSCTPNAGTFGGGGVELYYCVFCV